MAANLQTYDGDFGFQIAPMVDIIFVLMLFFMACVAFQDEEFKLRASIPAPAYPATIKIAIDVRIADSGDVYLQDKLIAGGDDRTLKPLINWLQVSKERFGATDPVVIAPAPMVKHERIIEVLNAVDTADWDKVSLR